MLEFGVPMEKVKAPWDAKFDDSAMVQVAVLVL